MVISRLGCDKFTTETSNLALEEGRSGRPNINKATLAAPTRSPPNKKILELKCVGRAVFRTATQACVWAKNIVPETGVCHSVLHK
jgi:hypothetical protein